jgi:uncharacterized damage-inducible protein DinB
MRFTKSVLAAVGMICTFGLSPTAAQAPSAARPPQTFPIYLQGQYATLKNNLIGSAEKMPAEHFGFKPSPDVRSYAELFGHTMEAQYGYCSAAKGEPFPAIAKGLEKSTTEKAAVVKMVKDAFAYCDAVYAGLTTESAMEMITAGTAPNQRQLARGNQLTMLIVHGNEHYGNLVTYMRIKGIVPPSSAQ